MSVPGGFRSRRTGTLLGFMFPSGRHPMRSATSARHDVDAPAVAAFLERHPEPAGRFLAVPAWLGDPLAGVARAVLHEAGAAGDEPRHSRFLVVLDRERVRPAGAMRYADDGPVRTFTPAAVPHRYRGKRSAVIVGTLLYRALYRSAAADGVHRLETATDRAGYRTVRLIGLPLRPAGDPGPGDTLRLAGDVAGFERSIAEQAARLRRAARPGGPEVRRVDQRTLAERRIGADIARRLATGDGLDEHILNLG
jgi:hypothetical protein